VKYLTFNESEIPVEKTFEIYGTNYRIAILYNEYGNFYSLYLKTDTGDFLYTTKIVYGVNIIHAKIPGFTAKIIPLKPEDLESGVMTENSVTPENFDAVRLYVV